MPEATTHTHVVLLLATYYIRPPCHSLALAP